MSEVMRFWWVNHKQTFQHEVGKGYLWSPKRKKDGSRNHFYETMREVQRGDLVFSFAVGHLQAVGTVTLPAYSCPRPDEFGKVGELWDKSGWRIDVAFKRFYRPLQIAAISHVLAPRLPARYSPIRANGHGNQGVYLAEISRSLATMVLRLAEPTLVGLANERSIAESGPAPMADPWVIADWEDRLQRVISENDALPETTRRALVAARRGQGIFKRNVRQLRAGLPRYPGR